MRIGRHRVAIESVPGGAMRPGYLPESERPVGPDPAHACIARMMGEVAARGDGNSPP